MAIWLMRFMHPSARVQHPDFAVWAERTSLHLVPFIDELGWVAWLGTYPTVHAFHATAEGAVQELCRFLYERGGCDLATKLKEAN